MTANDGMGTNDTDDRREDSVEDLRWVWDDGLRDAFRGVLEIEEPQGPGNVRVIYVIPDLEVPSRNRGRN
jgi:hypothetical protein